MSYFAYFGLMIHADTDWRSFTVASGAKRVAVNCGDCSGKLTPCRADKMTTEADHVLRYLGLVCPKGFRRFSRKYQLFWDQELLAMNDP